MRIRNKPWAEDELRKNPRVIFGPETKKNISGHWQEFFGNSNPIHLEIGTGKGHFIIEIAEQHPEINFIGFEKVEEVLIYPARYAVEYDKKNMAFIYGDAQFITNYFAPGEVERIYLNFSDPWPKKRHHKRRLTHPRFLNLYKEVLKVGGEIHFKTDNRDFFEFSLEKLSGNGFLLKNITFDLHNSEYAEKNIMTRYEKKWVEMGKAIYRLEAIWTGK
ncbi:tRNA (guanosine(46)-N7)-methyltransferase TrmB [Anoxybacter fermentans]|uniref:tRNA (guanine-N(7)-)-methyltransferase n=1 Tax=Anoxybacter fermentans TaxID=1323375 RepID=A0A3Q9HNN2_9FIRM|nr:tRNA (guanosine(46)-N7)-methyltransferase TrmB [Anoxybacter fermentans]AZR72118.1 tRNA (guanosine(46)-N7)-methyltransferase TrmB [Anoxybacter fermentans]